MTLPGQLRTCLALNVIVADSILGEVSSHLEFLGYTVERQGNALFVSQPGRFNWLLKDCCGGEIQLIDLAGLRGTAGTTAAPARATKTRRPAWGRREVMTMLFGDIVGFSKLKEAEAPSFFVNFLGLVARQIEQSAPPPATCNTWGDGLYMVFKEAAAAAEFALGLRDRIARTDWQSHDLPVGLSARIGMHSGPVFQAFDPIIQRINYFGSHVTRAARIEPVTAPGSVYVSEQTAALLSAGGSRDFACDYLGQMALAKGYGRAALYRLRRARGRVAADAGAAVNYFPLFAHP